jgi:PPOX class probable F420-dependent enzyme
MALDDRTRRFLEAPNFASIATTMPDGAPHVSTVWIDLDGDDVWVNTAEGRVKTDNVRRDPRVSISVFDQQDDPYEQVVIHGTVVELRHEGADEHIDRLAKKYLGVDAYPWRDPGERRVILRIRPDRLSSG